MRSISSKMLRNAFVVVNVMLQQAIASPIQPRAIDDTTFANLQLFEQFAAASYCPSNADKSAGGAKLTCPADNRQSSTNCPLVEADTTITLYEFQNSLLTDVTGFLASDSSRKLTVLSFRGSESVRNFLADADFPTTPTPELCPTCSIFTGFYTSWNEARSGVLAALQSATAANPDYRLVITGHSLGGAIAAIAAAEVRKSGQIADLYTYGQPRIGGSVVSDFITNQSPSLGNNFRVTHYDDPVPRLPPLALGFRHLSPEYYISSKNQVVVTEADVKGPLKGGVNLMGNTGNFAGGVADLDAHGWYFNNVSACNPSGGFEFKGMV